MKKPPVTATFTWDEAANLLVAAQATLSADTRGWTPAARANLRTAIEALMSAIPMEAPESLNAMFLVVKGQTVVRRG